MHLRTVLAALLTLTAFAGSQSLSAQEAAVTPQPDTPRLIPPAPRPPPPVDAAATPIPPAPPADLPAAPMGRGRGRGAVAPPRAPRPVGDPFTCSFDATIYDIRVPVEQVGRIDIKSLSQTAASAPEFEKAMAAIGTMRPLYRVNQSVSLRGDSILIGIQQPYVTNSQVTRTGTMLNSVTYTSTGASFSISGKVSSPPAIDLDLAISLAMLMQRSAPVNGTFNDPVLADNLSHIGPITPAQPFVIASINAANTDTEGKVIAHIARVTLGTPQPQPPR